MDPSEQLAHRYHEAVQAFDDVLSWVRDDDWSRPTPCAEWDVRALVAHVVDEHRWVAPLLAGRTIAEVERGLDPDPLGDDARAAWRSATSESLEAFGGLDDLGRIVHLSFGDVPASLYAAQLVTDHVVHAWDLARAVDVDDRADGGIDAALPAGLVGAVLDWFGPMEDGYRAAGVIAERVDVGPDARLIDRLVAMAGRDPAWHPA